MDEESRGRTIESYDIQRLLDCLPHRYPLLLVDRIVEARGDEYCVGIKNVTYNEPQFQGHFPGKPVMPGVLLIEGMAQTAGALCVASHSVSGRPSVVYLMTIDKVKFRKPGHARRSGALPHDPPRPSPQHVVVPRRGDGRRRPRLRGDGFCDVGE